MISITQIQIPPFWAQLYRKLFDIFFFNKLAQCIPYGNLKRCINAPFVLKSKMRFVCDSIYIFDDRVCQGQLSQKSSLCGQALILNLRYITYPISHLFDNIVEFIVLYWISDNEYLYTECPKTTVRRCQFFFVSVSNIYAASKLNETIWVYFIICYNFTHSNAMEIW